MDRSSGSVEEFRSNWERRPESTRYHFKRGEPENQVQFAFQNHWSVFRKLLKDNQTGRVLEVGSGRGSMGAFFADNGFTVHLLDTSESALKSASTCFASDGLCASAVCGDALALPYRSGMFDVVVSVGLLEHFENIEAPIAEQLRVLKPGGCFLGYVVPERRLSVQTLAVPLTALLRIGHGLERFLKESRKPLPASTSKKVPLYRNQYCAADYLAILRKADVRDCGSFGMFPVPLVSHSTAFPFSLMAPSAEKRIVRIWRRLLSFRDQTTDPWICSERWGLAFLVWARR